MHTRLSFGRTSAVVDCPKPLNLWARMAHPFAALSVDSDAGSMPVLSVAVWFSHELPEVGAGPELGLHGSVMAVVDGDGRLRRTDGQASYHLSSGNGRAVINICYNSDYSEWQLDLFQVVRGYVQAAEEALGGWRKVHASAVSTVAGATIFVGDSGAGKTSFMLSSLQRYGASFVANDKLHVSDTGIIRGLPMAASISLDMLGSVPEIEIRPDSRVIGGDLYLWPLDLSEELDCGLVVEDRCHRVVIADLRLADSGVSLRRAGADEVALMMSGPMSVFTDRIQPWWAIEGALPRVEPSPPDVLQHAEWYVASGNPWVGQNPLFLKDQE